MPLWQAATAILLIFGGLLLGAAHLTALPVAVWIVFAVFLIVGGIVMLTNR
jgi:hypothetical protein